MVSFKGGTGKTSIALHISSALSIFHKKRCLLIDSDPQANLSQSLGFSPDSHNALPAVLQKKEPMKKVIQETKIKGLNLVRANTYLDQIESTPELLVDPYSHERLREELKSVCDIYDYCFIDLPPSLSWLSMSSFYASDFSLIAAVPEPFSMMAMDRLAKYHISINHRHTIKVLGVLFSLWDERGAINKEIMQGIENSFPKKILKTKIRQDKKLSRAVLQGLPVFLTDKKSRAGDDFKEAAKEILSVLKKDNFHV